MQAVESFRIREGQVYTYLPDKPRGCKGQKYRVLKFVLDVPSYQRKVLVEALTGPDKGLWFVVTPQNFAIRYAPFEESNP